MLFGVLFLSDVSEAVFKALRAESLTDDSPRHQQIKLLHDLKQSLFNSTQALLLNQKDYSFAHNESQKAHFQLHESVDQQDASLSEDGETGAEMTTVSRPKDGQLDDKDSSNPLSTADEYTAMSLNSSCHYSCRCKCHQLQNSQSPGSLAWLGTAFMQSRAVSLFSSPECDIVSCRSEASPSLRMVYIFPQWLLARSIEIAVSWSALTGAGSSLHLRVPRVLGKHPVWRAISLGDFDWIQRNLAKKTILPTDVGEHGQSLAWVSGLREWNEAVSGMILMKAIHRWLFSTIKFKSQVFSLDMAAI